MNAGGDLPRLGGRSGLGTKNWSRLFNDKKNRIIGRINTPLSDCVNKRGTEKKMETMRAVRRHLSARHLS